MALADALALAPGLDLRPDDPDADRRRLADLADWCGRYTPFVAVDPILEAGRGGLFLDLSGCETLFGGLDRLLADLARRLGRLGFGFAGAVATTAGGAWALARHDGVGSGVIATDAAAATGAALRDRLAALPVAALRLDAAMVDRLGRFGLFRVEDLYRLARAPLVARFGDAPVLRLDQALGRTGEAINPRRPPPAHAVRLALAEPIATTEAITAALRRLLADLAVDLGRAGVGARRLEASLWRVDGVVRRIAVGTHRPVRDPDRLARLLLPHLDKLEVGFGIETVGLAAPEVEPLTAAQRAIELGDADPAADGDETVAALVDRLVDRLGAERVLVARPRAHRLPERRFAWQPVGAPPPPADPAMPSAPARVFPPRLLARPEPIEAVALLPDAPPRLFRRRDGAAHRLVKVEGPERLAPEWWTGEGGAPRPDQPATRDYYRVEDDTGRRFWLFRQGLWSDAPGAVAPAWFLHGHFA